MHYNNYIYQEDAQCAKNLLNQEEDSLAMRCLDSGTWKVLFGYGFARIPDGILHLPSAGHECGSLGSVRVSLERDPEAVTCD